MTDQELRQIGEALIQATLQVYPKIAERHESHQDDTDVDQLLNNLD